MANFVYQLSASLMYSVPHFTGKLMGSSCAKPEQKGGHGDGRATSGAHYQQGGGGNAHIGGAVQPKQSNVNQSKSGGPVQPNQQRTAAPGSESRVLVCYLLFMALLP